MRQGETVMKMISEKENLIIGITDSICTTERKS